jgi:hypothetical protein
LSSSSDANSSFTYGSFFTHGGVEEDPASPSRMTISVERHGGGGYGAERAGEMPFEEALHDVNLVGMGV